MQPSILETFAPMSSRIVQRPRLFIAALVALVGAALIAYSQTLAFAWDEGYHMVTAQSILRGKRPYLDFCFPQTPLNAYWNAGWMRIFGDTWRTAHAVAAVMTTIAVLLMVDYLWRRFPVPEWRLPAAVTAVFIIGLNHAVFEFGTVGQAYGFCLFWIVLAFRCGVQAVERPGVMFAAAAGFAACASANSSLLTASVGPVLLLWMLVYNREGRRWTKFAAYVGGAVLPCVPLLSLFLQGPRQTLFNVLDYQFRYRTLEWEGALVHDFGVALAWLDSATALPLAVLAAGGLYYVYKLSGWQRRERAEFYLCAWLAVGLICHIGTAHPNFARYYLFAVPFMAVLACAGLYAACCRLIAPDRPWWPVAVLCLIACLGFVKALVDGREDMNWLDIERTARKVNEVTPPQGTLLADELTYFVSKHPPYPGTELMDSHKLTLPPALEKEMHVISHAELDQLIKAGTFDTVETDADDDRLDEMGVKQVYKHRAEIEHDFKIFWGKTR